MKHRSLLQKEHITLASILCLPYFALVYYSRKNDLLQTGEWSTNRLWSLSWLWGLLQSLTMCSVSGHIIYLNGCCVKTKHHSISYIVRHIQPDINIDPHYVKCIFFMCLDSEYACILTKSYFKMDVFQPVWYWYVPKYNATLKGTSTWLPLPANTGRTSDTSRFR